MKPPPLSRLSITADEVFTGEPTHEKLCRDLVERIGGIHNHGPYTPYSNKAYRVVFPLDVDLLELSLPVGHVTAS